MTKDLHTHVVVNFELCPTFLTRIASVTTWLAENVTLRVALDAVFLVAVFIPVAVFHFAVYPFKRGFFCNDESISHPFKGSTISTTVLIVVGLSLPMVTMLVTEIVIYVGENKGFTLGKKLKSTYSMCKRDMHPFLVALYQAWGPFLFGAAANQSTTDIFKYSIGRLRPHFLSVCQPDYTTFSCTNPQGQWLYIEANVCTGDADLIKEARLSHVSGHSSLSVYVMVYLSFYLQAKLTWRGSKLLRPLLQTVVLYMALYTCLSRISDYKHHWSDVLGGGLLGLITALLTVRYLSNLYRNVGIRSIVHKMTELQNLGQSPTHVNYGTGNGATFEVEDTVVNPKS